MKYLYVSNSAKQLTRYICTIKDNQANDLYTFTDINTIAPQAFQNASDIKEIIFNGNLKTIKKEAFKDSESLEIFACKHTKDNTSAETREQSIQNFVPACLDDTFTIETSAFSKCRNLHTVILPDCKKLVIEKAAFTDCNSLRTLVCHTEEIVFTENPFESCPETLTFVGTADSPLERFARENNYRYVNE